jgi:hypothetical protein
MMDFLLDEVKLTQQVGNVANSLVADYGIQHPDDLKHLGQRDLAELIANTRLKKAQAGKLTDAWKNKVGIHDPRWVPAEGDATFIDHGRRLLTQIYYRQNLYTVTAQFFDRRDLKFYLAPIIIATSMASFLGFMSCSVLIDDNSNLRCLVGLSTGICGVVATALTALRNTSKFDVRAEMFRAAASQYRILATKLERRIRLHRHVLNEVNAEGGTEEERRALEESEKRAFMACFAESYERIVIVQAQMPYFPPRHKVAEWIAAGTLNPSPIDQPMAKFRARGYQLAPAERARALHLLTHGHVPFGEFCALPEVQALLGPAPRFEAEEKREGFQRDLVRS